MSASSSKRAEPLKALILAGGRGKRLSEVTEDINKCMIVFRGRPLIEYSLENAVRLGVDEMIIVVGHLAEQIINRYGIDYRGTRISYVIQKAQLGLVHALSCSQAAVGGADFVLFLGDEFFIDPDHQAMIDAFSERDAFAVCGVIEVEDRSLIRKTYSILYDTDSRAILRLVEKPANPLNRFMGTGNIVFRNRIFEYIEKTPINPQRGERELPDFIQCAIDDGKPVFFHVLASKYVNVNTDEDITILNELPPS